MSLIAREKDDTERARARLYVVFTSHLDSQWRWTIQTTIRHFLHRTLLDNFERMRSHPRYALSFEGAFRYQLIEQHYPEEFQELVALVRQGRWHPAGGMLDAPDTNVPSPESLIRHLLYGNDYFEAKFGRRSVDLFLPDCFGFPWSLPTLAAHCGIRGLSSQKHVRWMAPAELPFDIGRWEGPDGASIVAVLDPGGYGRPLREDLSRSAAWRERIEGRRRQGGPAVAYGYYGLGDRGGAPDPTSLDYLERSLSGDGDIEIVHGASDQFFRDLSPADRDRLPVHRGDLLLPTHGTGCWTSQAVLKKWNRRCEILAEAAERACLAADWLGAQPYPERELRNEWTRFLWHQMHDDVTGTSSPEAYRFTWNDLILAQNRLSGLLSSAVSAVARGLDTDGAGPALVVFNALGSAREGLVDTWVRFESDPPRMVRVLDPEGLEVPCQELDRRDGRLRLLFPARVPSVGFAVYRVLAAEADLLNPVDSELAVSARHLENSRYRVHVDEAGAVSSLVDKHLGRELLSAPMDLELLPDRSARWPAWEIRYEDVCAKPSPLAETAQVRIAERGPVRVKLEITRTAGETTFRQWLSLAAGAPGEHLEVEHEIDWHSPGKLLKAAFPVAIERERAVATYDLGLGSIERAPNTREKYEVPAHEWADLSSETWGVSILSRHSYGWDRPEAARLRLSLLRSPSALRRFAHQAAQDFGRHRLAYAILGHGPLARAEVSARAASFGRPFFAFQAEGHAGELGRRFSLFGVSGNAELMALKKSERTEQWIARVRETGGEPADVRLEASGPIVKAAEIDGCEREPRPQPTDRGKLATRLPGFAPRTFRLDVARSRDHDTRQPNLEQAPVPLPFDTRATSFHGHRGTDFDGRGHSLPGELYPEGSRFLGVDLAFGPNAPGARNALACRGQEVELPPGDFDRLLLVAAATDRRGAVVEIAGLSSLRGAGVRVEGSAATARLRIPYYSGFVGQWKRFSGRIGFLLRRFQPGFIERTPVVWTSSHRHDRKVRDQVYTHCYLFAFEGSISPGARALKLPRAPRVKIFAATAFASARASIEPGHDFYE